MKIASITMVKNESDIIESFVRYNLNVVDEMIILDNGSTDETLKILNKLKDENLPIHIFQDEDKNYEQDTKITALLKKAVYEFNADIICPLDADEFLTSDTNNPRKLIEQIKPDTYFFVKWRSYVPLGNENYNEKFIPSKIINCFDEKIEKYYKVIIPKELVINFDAKISMGNHNIIYDQKYKNQINSKKIEELRISHFPLRSREQTLSKILVGWPNILSRLNHIEGQGNHWERIFNKIKSQKKFTNDDLIEFAKVYCLDSEEEIEFFEKPINLSFCKKIILKYDFNYNHLENILENVLYLSKENNALKKSIKEKDQIIIEKDLKIKELLIFTEEQEIKNNNRNEFIEK